MRSIIIVGSSNPHGQTMQKSQLLNQSMQGDLISLRDYQISHFDYEHKNRGDDFLPLMQRIVANYDVIIFATPVYWYSMSGIMKVFFDRISDLLKIEKDLGRQLRGKHMAVLSSSNGNNLEESFWLPFKETAGYLGMHYLGNVHTYDNQDADSVVKNFAKSVKERYQSL